MRKVIEENERAKRAYVFYLEEAKGLDQKSTDKVLAAILRFEQSTGFKTFKRFHIEQASRFKSDLAKAKGKSGKPLSHATVDATLALVRGFFPGLRARAVTSHVSATATPNISRTIARMLASHIHETKNHIRL